MHAYPFQKKNWPTVQIYWSTGMIVFNIFFILMNLCVGGEGGVPSFQIVIKN